MKYFLHDTNSFQDEKITELFIQHGYEGLGLFYTILEKLAMQEKPVKTIVLKKQLSVGKKLEKVWSFLEEIELIYSNNGETFNENILKFSEKYQIKKEKTKERVSQWRDNQRDSENVTRYNDVRNDPKVKESKVNINKESSSEVFADATTPPRIENSGENNTLENEEKKGPTPDSARPPSQKRIMDRPTLDQVRAHFNLQMSPEWLADKFFYYYESNGWMAGRVPMKKWQAAASKWIGDEKQNPTRNAVNSNYNSNPSGPRSAINPNNITQFGAELDAIINQRYGAPVGQSVADGGYAVIVDDPRGSLV